METNFNSPAKKTPSKKQDEDFIIPTEKKILSGHSKRGSSSRNQSRSSKPSAKKVTQT